MSYTKNTTIDTTGPNFAPGESVVTLADGSNVAVSCRQLRCTTSQCTVFQSLARWIDDAGATKRDAQGHAVTTTHRHTTSDTELAAVDTLRACLMLVLGEPQPTTTDDQGQTIPVVPFGAEALSTCSIARAIQAAKATFDTVDVGAAL